MTAPVADLLGAFIEHTKELPNTAALIGTRVASRMRARSASDPGGWQMPTYAVVWHMVPGPTPRRPGNTPVRWQPMQAECYGADLRAARLLWRTLHAELFPDAPTPQGFRAVDCAVFQINESGAPFARLEAPDYPRVIANYLVEYLERPI